MRTSPLDLAARSLAIGYATGLRSQAGPAVVLARRRPGSLPRRLRALDSMLTRPAARWVSTAAMVGEFAGDKAPSTPDRCEPGPAIGRLLGGALAGSLLAASRHAPRRGRASTKSTVLGAVIGMAGAAGGTWLGIRARVGATEAAAGGRSDSARRVAATAVALAEDGLAVALAMAATRGIRDR